MGLMFFFVGGIDARAFKLPTKNIAPAPIRAAEVKLRPSAAQIAGAVAGAAAGAAGATALRVPTATPPTAAMPGSSPAAASPVPAPAVPPPAVAPMAPPAYSYNPAGKSDPFLPFVETDLAVKKEKEKRAKEEELRKRAAAAKHPISPLQQAEIGQFRLVGIAGDDQRRVAIVEDGVAKKFYPLSVGTYIGPNGGRIVSILPDRLIVEEPLQEPSNKGKKAQTRRMAVMLHKEEEGKP